MKRFFYKTTALTLAAIMTAAVGMKDISAHSIGNEVQTKQVPCAQTVLTYANGTQRTLDGVAEARQPALSCGAGVDAYDILYNGESKLSVALHGASSGDSVGAGSPLNSYYSVTFAVAGNREGFLTGLDADRVDEIERAVMDCCQKGKAFTVTDIGFIDAEKTGAADSDSMLCWAAATSNILTYTGWAAEAGFEDEDAMFEAFIDNFNDDGAYLKSGFSWFFNGVMTDDSGAIAVCREGSGGYLPAYPYESVVRERNFSGRAYLTGVLFDSLRKGSGVVLAGVFGVAPITFCGHALSCWGGLVNNDYSENEEAHYEMLFCTDSDSDLSGSADRRTAANRLFSLTLTVDSELDESYGEKGWFCPNYGLNFFLTDFIIVRPAGDGGILLDSHPDATLDRKHDPDFKLKQITFSPFAEPSITGCGITAGEDVFFTPQITNVSAADYNGPLDCRFTLQDSSGKALRVFRFSESVSVKGHHGELTLPTFKIGSLPADDYSVLAQINPDHTVSEAFYLNNNVYEFLEVSDEPFRLDDPAFTVSDTVTGVVLSGQRVNIVSASFSPLDMDFADRVCCDEFYFSARDNGGDWLPWQKTNRYAVFGGSADASVLISDTAHDEYRLLRVLVTEGDEENYYFVSAPFTLTNHSSYVSLIDDGDLALHAEQIGIQYDEHDGYLPLLRVWTDGFHCGGDNGFNPADFAAEWELAVSYYREDCGKWSDYLWPESDTGLFDSDPPACEITTLNEARTIRLRLTYEPLGGDPIVLETAPMSVSYPSVTVSAAPESTVHFSPQRYSNINYDHHWNDGEAVIPVLTYEAGAFCDEPVEGSYRLIARTDQHTAYFLTDPIPFCLHPGETLTCDPITRLSPSSFLPSGKEMTLSLLVYGMEFQENVLGTFTVSPEYTVSDVDGDGKTTITDVTLIQSYLAEKTVFDEEQMECADVDDDGIVSIADATFIQMYLAGYYKYPYIR